jgi:hypothetical protein
VGLLQMLARDHNLEQLRDARDEADCQVRQTAGRPVQVTLDAAAEHQLKALPQVAKREVERAEADAGDTVHDALSLLISPARAGWRALERLVEPEPVRPGSKRAGPGDWVRKRST